MSLFIKKTSQFADLQYSRYVDVINYLLTETQLYKVIYRQLLSV